MKLEDARIGMEIVDKFGNEYVIIGLTNDCMPVKLKCTKLENECVIDDTTEFVAEDDERFPVFPDWFVARNSFQAIKAILSYTDCR